MTLRRCGHRPRFSTDDNRQKWCRSCFIKPVRAHLQGKLRMRQGDPAGTWSFEAPPTYTVEGGP